MIHSSTFWGVGSFCMMDCDDMRITDGNEEIETMVLQQLLYQPEAIFKLISKS